MSNYIVDKPQILLKMAEYVSFTDPFIYQLNSDQKR